MARYSPDNLCQAALETRGDRAVTSMCHRGMQADNACSCALASFNCARISLAFSQPAPYDPYSLVPYLAARNSVDAILPTSVPDTVQQVPFIKNGLNVVQNFPDSPPERVADNLRRSASAINRRGFVGSAVIAHSSGTFTLICTTTTTGISTFCVFDPHSRGQYDGATFFFFDSISPMIGFLQSLLGTGTGPESPHSRSEQPLQPQLAGELTIYTFSPENPSASDLAFLTQSAILFSIENIALRVELARQMENAKLKRAKKRETRKLNSTFSALGLEFEAGVDEDESMTQASACGPDPPSEAGTVIVEDERHNSAPAHNERTPQRRRQLASIALPPSSETASPAPIELECGVCMEARGEATAVLVDPCMHTICPDCMAFHVQSKLEARWYPIICPVCPMSPEHSARPSVIPESILTQLNIPADQFATFKRLRAGQMNK
ncbi:hypothetical protein DFH07DRAFT_765817 [Mycena maculata]|uniref:RING-type domain-containing protein n=1 Tax=Mycena maculata TaxID=230809 RepID=A0AAD7K7U5_9AGAR|nr:hypothetical protein DFH07DRAFT_765817 [Mycena maculata]